MYKLLSILLILNINLYAGYCYTDEVLTPHDTFSSVTTNPPSEYQYVTTNCSYVDFWSWTSDVVLGRYYYTREIYLASSATCPVGTVNQNGFCIDEASACSVGTLYEPYSRTCIPDPALADDDSDGIPNKCDAQYVDYSTSDCDSDGTSNATDPDIDGDGVPNLNDTNPYVSGTNDFDVACYGVDTTNTNTLPFQFSTYKFHSKIEELRCSALLYYSVYDSVVNLSDTNYPYCENSYCYVHEVENDCSLDSSWYMPSGSGWIYLPGRTESECNSLVDAINYSENSFQIPKVDCPGLCYVKEIDDTPPPDDTNQEDNDESMGAVDLNSTSSDLAPLLQAQNTTNKHLDDLKNKTDITNNNLDDLKDTSGGILSTNKDIKSGIDGLKSNSDKSLKNQSDGLSKLASISSGVDGVSDKLGLMSDAVTGNQALGNFALNSIDGKMTTNNSLLTNLDTTQTSSNSLLQEMRDFFIDGDENSTSSENLDFVTSQFGSILGKYTIDLGGGACGTISTISTSLHGQTLVFLSQATIDKLPVSDMKAMIIFLFTITGLMLVFRGN